MATSRRSRPLGKFIAGVTMVAGLALFSLPVGIIANGFVTGLSRRRFAITWNMLRRQPLFQGLDGDAMTEVLDAPTASIVREHAQIVVEGKEATDCYLIVSGIAHGEFADEQRPLGPATSSAPRLCITPRPMPAPSTARKRHAG